MLSVCFSAVGQKHAIQHRRRSTISHGWRGRCNDIARQSFMWNGCSPTIFLPASLVTATKIALPDSSWDSTALLLLPYTLAFEGIQNPMPQGCSTGLVETWEIASWGGWPQA